MALSGTEAESVLLETVALTFDVLSSDDFGVRRAGLEWRRFGRLGELGEEPDGEKVLRAGAADATTLQSFATFKPAAMGLEAGVFELRGWAEDAVPGRERSTSTPVRVRVMTPDQHMQWVTARLERWRERAVEVRDRRWSCSPRTRRCTPSAAPSSTAPRRAPASRTRRGPSAATARLQGLVAQGKKLLSEAARNEEFGSNTLDDWAETNAKLQDIAETRMDSVAKLLQQAARAEASSGGSPSQPSRGRDAAGLELRSGAAGERGGRVRREARVREASEGRRFEPLRGRRQVPEDHRPGPRPGAAALPAREREGEEGDEKPEDAIPPTPTIMDGESGVAMEESGDGPEDEEAGEKGSAPKASDGLVETTLSPAAREEEAPTDPNITPGGRPRGRAAFPHEGRARQGDRRAGGAARGLQRGGGRHRVRARRAREQHLRQAPQGRRPAQTETSEELDGSVAKGFGSEVAISERRCRR